jgi:RNA polymerase sigma-70 factor (ECF subfamily)
MPEEEIIAGIYVGGAQRHAALRAWIKGPVGARMQRFFISHGIALQDAEDVLQETIVNVVTKIHTYRADGAARSWLWQIARNCMTDFFRKSGTYLQQASEREEADTARRAAANDAVMSVENGARVTKLPYIASHENSRREQAVPRQVLLDEDQWRVIEQTTAIDGGDTQLDSVDECVDRGMDAFVAQMPERAEALNMQMDGASISQIADHLGRTVAATKEYLSQCRKHLQPFVAHCTALLSP